MSTSAQGTVIGGNGAGVGGLTVVLEDVSALFDRSLARGETTSTGTFALTYEEDFSEGGRELRLRIRVGQHLVKEDKRTDVSSAELSYGQIPLPGTEGTSVLATLGTGTASRLSHGNALEWLCDDVDAWKRVADLIRNADSHLDVMQLTISMGKFNALATAEKPQIVLDFHSPEPSAAQPRTVDANDGRIERLLLAASQKPNVIVRIQIPVPTVDLHVLPFAGLAGVIVGLALLSLIAGLLVGFVIIAAAIIKLDRHFGRGVRVISDWFAAAHAQTQVRVRALHTELFSITHTKLVIDGEKKAILLGSPFEQVYYDSQAHVLDEPRRGDDAGVGPIHDVSVSVRGPAVGHMQEVFNSHWNLADSTDPLPLPPPTIPQVTTAVGAEHLTSVQVVRTLNPRTFKDVLHLPNGEKGILEAYLRAIHFAQRFIYLENQYFNDEAVTDALIDVLKNKPHVKVILLINLRPDMPHYPMWQRTTIIRLAEAAGANVANQLGVFTKWSHAASSPPTHPKPRLARHYLHTKTAIIDNKWATVGSGNIDGASLDEFQAFWYSRLANVVLEGGASRNTETNCVVFEETPPAKSAVDDLRRRLWAEHLGVLDAAGKIKPDAAELNDSPTKDWLAVWVAKADAKKAKLISTPDDPSPITILPWPQPKKVRKATSNSHLALLGIPVAPFDLVPHGAPSFDFKTGVFKK